MAERDSQDNGANGQRQGRARRADPLQGARSWQRCAARGAAGKRARWPRRSRSPASAARSSRRSPGCETDRIYTPEHVQDLDYERDLGFPGQYPFTRGIQPTMYRGRYWTIRQYAGFGTPEATNERFKFLLSQGQPGLSTAFDLPTQMGLDSDDERAAGEVGQVGVAIDSLADMETVFDGIPLDQVSTSMTINAPAPVLVAMYVAVADKQGVARETGLRHRAERRAQGVRRARDVHLPAQAVAAAGRRPDRMVRDRRAALQRDLAVRLPHARGRLDGGPGDRLQLRQRDRLHRGGARARRRASTRSRRGCRGSSTRTSTSSRRSPSTARCGGCGRGS